MIVSKDDFFKYQSKIEVVPFSQSEAWLDANHESQEGIVYFVNKIDLPSICCYGECYHQRFIGRRLIINGISCSKGVDADNLRDFFKDIRDNGFDVVTISDISEYDPSFEVGIRRAGFIRPLGLNLCPLTMMVNLQGEFTFHRNWKRNVKKSIAAGNSLIHVDNPTIDDANCFVNLFVKMQDRKSLGYMITPESIDTLLKGPFDLFFIEDSVGERISGRIEYKNENFVYDIYAANISNGIKSGAAYHIQQGIFEYYKEKGVELFDYGRIPPSATEMDNIYVAKKYSGGYPIGYNGQWIYSNATWKLYLLSCNDFIHYKQHIY